MIHENKTIHLNRDTLPGLASFLSINLAETDEDTPARKMALNAETMEILERRRGLLAEINTLIIDDIQVMFGEAWREDLVKFCSTVVLPNVTKIIWRQDELREWEPPKQLGADKWMMSPPMPFSSDAEYKLLIYRPVQFDSVLPAKDKEVCIVVPASGYFQSFGHPSLYVPTKQSRYQPVPIIDRIVSHIVKFSGNLTVRLHQPISPEHIAICRMPNTIYSFYTDYWNQPAKPRLINAFNENMTGRLRREYSALDVWVYHIFPAIENILDSDMGREEMLDECKHIVGHPGLFGEGPGIDTDEDMSPWDLGMVSAMIQLLHSDHGEVECGCCGELATSLKGW